jgi:Holliday junction DNA helicase RuvB
MNENLDPTTNGITDELDLKKLRPYHLMILLGRTRKPEGFVEATNQRNEALDHTLFFMDS